MNGAPEGFDQGKIVGFAVGKVVGDEGEVESIAVREREQRRGVGQALLESVMGWCGAEGAERIELEVRAGGMAARSLYEKVGFNVVGIRPGYYADPAEDAVLMRWVSGAGEGPAHIQADA